MKPFTALLGASAGAHAADQLAVAALPLTATLALKAGPETLGLLIAIQSAAWPLVSLPAGAWIDRYPRRRLLIAALGLGLVSAATAVVATLLDSTALLGVAAFAGAAGTAIYVMIAIAMLPSLVAASDLSRANSRLELARAGASLVAPFLAGLLAQYLSPNWGWALAAAGAALAIACALSLPTAPAPGGTADRPRILAAIREGAAFVVCHDLLRGLSLCSIAGNFALFALLAIWAPLALGPLGLNPASMGLAQSANGIGFVVGALAGPFAARALSPAVTLVLGPASATFAAVLFLVGPQVDGFLCAATGYFLIGFTWMLWQICQITVRQLVTPASLLGRVNATAQTAIYGTRPLGALAGGMVAAHAGLDSALWMVAVSCLVATMMIVFSPLARLRTLPSPVAA